jgi:hypothetical protein
MATNQNGRLVDDAGNVVVDFVWGNFPIQPNDVRAENGGTLLDYTLDSHNIVEDGWNGYPLYTPNDPGSQTGGVDYLTVPNLLGVAKADALALAGDLELNTTAQSDRTNATQSITDIDRTAGTYPAKITGTGIVARYPIGSKITISGTGKVDGTFTVTDTASTDQIYFLSAANTEITSGTGSVSGAAGTVVAQSIAAGQKRAAGTAFNVTAWATAS